MKLSFVNKKFLDKKGYIANVEFSNPDKHNALSSELLWELINVFSLLNRSEKVKVVILSAKRSSAVWSSGHNLEELKVRNFDPLSKKSAYKRFINLLKNYSKIVIASVDGTVWGGAVEIVMLCDIIIATPQTKFYLTALKIGFPYDTDGILNLSSVIGDKVFREMFFTAQGLSSKRAHQLGIINAIVRQKNLQREAYKLATEIAKNYGDAMQLVKKQLSFLNRKQLSTSELKTINSLRENILQKR